MTDYRELGFRCGIEIHQQLDTETKLFCDCETEMEHLEPAAQVRRSLRPTPGESGGVDQAAKYEFLKDQDFIYNIYHDKTCLVELDEEPPHPVNREALRTALEAAYLMDCSVPDEVQFMRKSVIDGSNTTGFQRTAIVALDGELETDSGTVQITDIELEEESASIHKRKEDVAIYDLDRLGIPLIEIGTDASIQSPEHAQEVAEELGMLMRSTGKVKRGLGTIRQDVNVSIEGGARIEVKGFQDVRNLQELVENEVQRQQRLLELKDDLQEDGIGEIDPQVVDLTDAFADTDNGIIGTMIENGGRVLATTLPLEGYMNRDLCADHHLGRELADHAEAQGLKGIMHTDEDVSKYGLEEEFAVAADVLGKEDGEVVVIAAGPDPAVHNAMDAVIDRADQLLEGVPEETRDADQDFTTTYSRPLPGSARMYPETDIPPIPITDEYREELREDLPATLREREQQLQPVIGEELAAQITSSRLFPVFERLREEFEDMDREIANLLTNQLRDIESRYDADTDRLTEQQFRGVLELLEDGAIAKDVIGDLLRYAIADPDTPVDALVEEHGLEAADDDTVEEAVQEVIEEKRDFIREQGEHAQGALMGEVMQKLGDGADGQKVNEILARELGKLLG